MGTKNNPGAFDCYSAADPDEAMFVLLGRDPLAPWVVRFWCVLRFFRRGWSAKLREAWECAADMDRWCKGRVRAR